MINKPGDVSDASWYDAQRRASRLPGELLSACRRRRPERHHLYRRQNKHKHNKMVVVGGGGGTHLATTTRPAGIYPAPLAAQQQRSHIRTHTGKALGAEIFRPLVSACQRRAGVSLPPPPLLHRRCCESNYESESFRFKTTSGALCCAFMGRVDVLVDGRQVVIHVSAGLI